VLLCCSPNYCVAVQFPTWGRHIYSDTLLTVEFVLVSTIPRIVLRENKAAVSTLPCLVHVIQMVRPLGNARRSGCDSSCLVLDGL
jgi:hypothetical protein